MKLYRGPYSCALGIHVLLEEIGAPYETERIDVADGATHRPPFTAVNPKGKPQDIVHRTVGLGRASVRRQGRRMVEQGFAIPDPQLGRHDYAAGDRFTIADAALSYVERWAEPQGIALPVNVAAHLARMLTRPAAHRVGQLWGEA